MREKIVNSIVENKLVVIVRGIESYQMIPLAEALYQGGVRLMEITYSADKSVADKEIADQISMLSEHMNGRMFIGAGTVLTEEQVKLTADAGGRFIISPNVSPDIIQKTRALNMVSIPGALTPTEIQTAVCSGADFVKLFPALAFGTNYIKAITAPLSHVRLLAVGGITLDSIRTYQSVGICGFGIGTSIVKKSLMDAGDFTTITALAKQYRDRIMLEG